MRIKNYIPRWLMEIKIMYKNTLHQLCSRRWGTQGTAPVQAGSSATKIKLSRKGKKNILTSKYFANEFEL